MGGGTTGIYPEDLPGGIQIFARIPVPIWDRDRRFPIFEDSICLLRPGDRVKFIPCELDEFEAVERMVDEATYPFNVVEYQTFSAPALPCLAEHHRHQAALLSRVSRAIAAGTRPVMRPPFYGASALSAAPWSRHGLPARNGWQLDVRAADPMTVRGYCPMIRCFSQPCS